jgi:hypothetical protein
MPAGLLLLMEASVLLAQEVLLTCKRELEVIVVATLA